MDNFWKNGSALFKNKLDHLMSSTNMDAKLFIQPMSPVLQIGPTCGFAALATALNSNYSKNIKLEKLVELAQNDRITNFGELFSVNWLVEFISRHWPQIHSQIMDFPTPFCIMQHLTKDTEFPTTFLIPYDSDKNFEPCNKNGHSAHWAMLIGFVILQKHRKLMSSTNEEKTMNLTKSTKSDFGEIMMNFDEKQFYLVAYQGKSRHPALWSYSSLRQSNAQLNVPNPTSNSNFRMAPEGMAAIKGKCCIFGGRPLKKGRPALN